MAKKTVQTDSWDSPENEVASNWVKFNVPMEDKILGWLIGKRQIKSTIPGQNGKLVNVYELRGIEGSYHVLDEKKRVVDTPVVVEDGAFYSVGGTNVIDRQMQNIRIGQKIGLKFIEEVPSKTKGFAPAKIIKVYAMKNEDGTPVVDEMIVNEQVVAAF